MIQHENETKRRPSSRFHLCLLLLNRKKRSFLQFLNRLSVSLHPSFQPYRKFYFFTCEFVIKFFAYFILSLPPKSAERQQQKVCQKLILILFFHYLHFFFFNSLVKFRGLKVEIMLKICGINKKF